MTKRTKFSNSGLYYGKNLMFVLECAVLHQKLKEGLLMKDWIRLEKAIYEATPPAEVTDQQVLHVMQQIADQKKCAVEFVCRGNKLRAKPKK